MDCIIGVGNAAVIAEFDEGDKGNFGGSVGFVVALVVGLGGCLGLLRGRFGRLEPGFAFGGFFALSFIPIFAVFTPRGELVLEIVLIVGCHILLCSFGRPPTASGSFGAFRCGGYFLIRHGTRLLVAGLGS
jgi:hypothetical protein